MAAGLGSWAGQLGWAAGLGSWAGICENVIFKNALKTRRVVMILMSAGCPKGIFVDFSLVLRVFERHRIFYV